MLALREGRAMEALMLADQASGTANGVGFRDGVALAQHIQGAFARLQGAHEQARALYSASLRVVWEEGHLIGVCCMLDEWAGIEADAGNDELAARLVGAVDGFCTPRGVVLPRMWGCGGPRSPRQPVHEPAPGSSVWPRPGRPDETRVWTTRSRSPQVPS
ncbi:MAG: hypothetical protein ACR2IK_08600 [Chloroflexota bacterium]